MTTGLEIRAQIDTENVKGLLLVNGGGAVALLAFLPYVLGRPGYEAIARAIIWSLGIYQIGLVSAVIHNRLRRICSLTYERHQYQPPVCKFLGFKLREPCVCHWSILFMGLSVIAFCLAGFLVFKGALNTLEQIQLSNKEPNVSAPQVTKAPPNKSLKDGPHENRAAP